VSGFEFDEIKSLSNKDKHGIDFGEAQRLWEDENRIVIPSRNLDEPRFLIIGKIEEKYWSAIYTMRQDKIRMISVRRSRNEEIETYES
jgi:uncharacterized DUF497 family protein